MARGLQLDGLLTAGGGSTAPARCHQVVVSLGVSICHTSHTSSKLPDSLGSSTHEVNMLS
jgi:hypothetical protein